MEVYTDTRIAGFLLNNATTTDEWAEARRELRDDLNMDPDTVPDVIDLPAWRVSAASTTCRC